MDQERIKNRLYGFYGSKLPIEYQKGHKSCVDQLINSAVEEYLQEKLKWFRKFLAEWAIGFCPICGYYENKKVITNYNTEYTSCKNECINKKQEDNYE